MTDPVHLLGTLPTATPGRVRADRVRARCHAELARTRTPQPFRRDHIAGAWEPLLACVGMLYLAESIRLALRLAGVL